MAPQPPGAFHHRTSCGHCRFRRGRVRACLRRRLRNRSGRRRRPRPGVVASRAERDPGMAADPGLRSHRRGARHRGRRQPSRPGRRCAHRTRLQRFRPDAQRTVLGHRRHPGGLLGATAAPGGAPTPPAPGPAPPRQSAIVGIPPAAKILSIRVNLEFNDPLNADQAITRRLPSAIGDGITYAVNHGARVIDLPLDPGTFGLTGHGDPAAAGGSPAEQAAGSYALRKNVVLVAPAGDDGEGPRLVNYPAAYAGVIAVGAVSRSGHLAPFSSKRSYVSLTAPGVNLTAATTPASYATISSTSTASGIVAGVAALLLSRFPHLTVAQ